MTSMVTGVPSEPVSVPRRASIPAAISPALSSGQGLPPLSAPQNSMRTRTVTGLLGMRAPSTSTAATSPLNPPLALRCTTPAWAPSARVTSWAISVAWGGSAARASGASTSASTATASAIAISRTRRASPEQRIGASIRQALPGLRAWTRARQAAQPPPRRGRRLLRGRLARGEVEIEQRPGDRDVGDQQRVDERAGEVDRDQREPGEDQREAEADAARGVDQGEEAGDAERAPPVVTDELRAAPQRGPDRLVLEQDLLLDELPLDELPDRERDADHADQQRHQDHGHQEPGEDQPPESAQRQLPGG